MPQLRDYVIAALQVSGLDPTDEAIDLLSRRACDSAQDPIATIHEHIEAHLRQYGTLEKGA